MSSDQFSFRTPEEKKAYVRSMFSGIAGRYDFLNHFLSLGRDHSWRKWAIRLVREHLTETDIKAPQLLDIACGTGDLAFEALKQIPSAHITAIDLAKPMLEIFEQKRLERKADIVIAEGDVEKLQFADGSFDAVTIGFGTRNFPDLKVAFKEIYRVLKPGGVFVNLELSRPRSFPMRHLYSLYAKYIIPTIGKRFSRHQKAYEYLPDSVERFPEREEIVSMLREGGFSEARWKDLTAGIVTMHIAVK